MIEKLYKIKRVQKNLNPLYRNSEDEKKDSLLFLRFFFFYEEDE